MPKPGFGWNEDSHAMLRRLWLIDGKSAEAIASALKWKFGGSLTRNAVLGKIDRLGLMGQQGKGEGQAPSAPRPISSRPVAPAASRPVLRCKSPEAIARIKTRRERKRERLAKDFVPVGGTSLAAEVQVLEGLGEMTPAPAPGAASLELLRDLERQVFGAVAVPAELMKPRPTSFEEYVQEALCQIVKAADVPFEEFVKRLELPSPPPAPKSAGAEFFESQILAAVAEEMASETASPPDVETESKLEDKPASYQAIEPATPARKRGTWRLLELRSCQCRWSDPRSDSFRFCGEPVVRDGSSWCAEHYKRVFTTASVELAEKQRRANRRRLAA